MVGRVPPAEPATAAPTVLAIPSDGLHELVLSALLDWVMADAFQAGVDELAWHGPPAFQAAFDRRRSWTPPTGKGLRGLLAFSENPPTLAGDRVYWVHRGGGVPVGEPDAWTLVSRQRFLGAWARAAGLPIRIGYGLGRPDTVDRVMAGMRRRLAPSRGWSRYTLEIWMRSR
jgi:hypothetical protein